MEKSTRKLLAKYKQKESITKQSAYSSGRILIRFKSQILYKEKFLTRYYKTYHDAKNHLKHQLIFDGKLRPNPSVLTYKRTKFTKITQLFKEIA